MLLNIKNESVREILNLQTTSLLFLEDLEDRKPNVEDVKIYEQLCQEAKEKMDVLEAYDMKDNIISILTEIQTYL